MRSILPVALAIAILCSTGAAQAQSDRTPVFGPLTFERTTGETNTYTETFDAPTGGDHILFLRNGDGDVSRVASATVTLNGVDVVVESDLDEEQPGLRRLVELQAGTNQLVVTVHGQPGSFFALAIGRPGREPVFVHGRLLLPWGRNDAQRALVLALKNGSPRAPRLFRVVFFAPNGEVVAASERQALPSQGSIALPVEALIDAGAWEIGSVEIFYAGPGVARLFGSARHFDLGSGISDIESLEQAGMHVFRGRPDNPEGVPPRRFAR